MLLASHMSQKDTDFEQQKMLVSCPIGLFPFPFLLPYPVLLLCSAARSVTTGECHLAQEWRLRGVHGGTEPYRKYVCACTHA